MATKEQFIRWAQTLGPMALQNEAEVETKFIIPLFQQLGYPDECRRDKYPLRSYSPGKQGRKPEVDLIYFSVDSPNEQGPDTSLVIVEAKEPERDRDGLVDDLNQARFYAYHLKVPILVVTNGRELIAVREHPHRAAQVFDGSIESLKSGGNAAAFFERLSFQAVKEVKEASFVEQTVLHFDDFSPPVPIHFCGRGEELSRLRAEIKQNSIIVIGGIAGIGKSYLAAQLAQELGGALPVIWLSFNPQTSLEQFLGGLAHYMRGTFGDATLLNAIQTQNATEELRIKLAAKQLDKYGCLLIWDNFNQAANKSFLAFLTACGSQLETGRLLLTTKEWIALEGLFNTPTYMPALASLEEEAGIELLQRLGTRESQVGTLKKAHERVGGHPQLLTLLAGLSKLFPLAALLEDLPHVPDKVNEYIQQRVLDTLEPDAKQMLYGLSLLKIPFQLSVVNHLSDKADRYRLFDKVLNRYLVTRLGQQSDRYDIHELVKAFCRKQLPAESLPSFHASLHAYYKDLPTQTYVDGRMLVYHALNGGLIDEAYEALNHLLSAALYEGMYDFILEYTSALLKDERVTSWGFIHFILGRVLRFKERYVEAKESYEAALRLGKDTDATELAKFELASVLTYLSETSEEIDIKLAREYYTGLRHSSNIEMQLRATSALGTLSVRDRDEECIPDLEAALSSAEQVDSIVNIYQLCICLGQAYVNIREDDEQAKYYLERALQTQLEHERKYGAALAMSLHITHLELAKLYERAGRFGDAVNSWKACVEINRKRGVPDLLSESLNLLGRAQLRTGNSNHAKHSFLESTELINKYELQGDVISQHLEWLTVALWESGDYERALEYSMELAYLSEESQGLRPLAIVSAFDAPARSEILRLRDKGFFMLVLPPVFNPNVISYWARKIKKRRPEFADLSLTALQNVSQSATTSGKLGERKVGRNETCPCGSKRKFKKCCGANSAI